MLKRSSLVCILLLAGPSLACAQQTNPPDAMTQRSVAAQPVPGAQLDPAHVKWTEKSMSKFLDADAPDGKPTE